MLEKTSSSLYATRVITSVHFPLRRWVVALLVMSALTVSYCSPCLAGHPRALNGAPSVNSNSKVDFTPVKGSEVVELPLVGRVDATRTSLVVLTVTIGALDGFNPCSFFVLFFLLSLLAHARSKGRIVVIGGTFVFFSGMFYFLFMSAWLNIFLVIGNLRFITAAAGALALVVAVINIKDFFRFKQGVSLVIPDSAKPKLFERMRGLMKSSRTSTMFAGTVALAVAANSYELLCTAGFPMVFTRALTLRGLTDYQRYLYIALYNAVYVVPLAVIVVVFAVTLGTRRLSEWQGRVLKLFSGAMMLALGLALLVRPALISDLYTSVGLMFAALASAGLTAAITRRAMAGKLGEA